MSVNPEQRKVLDDLLENVNTAVTNGPGSRDAVRLIIELNDLKQQMVQANALEIIAHSLQSLVLLKGGKI